MGAFRKSAGTNVALTAIKRRAAGAWVQVMIVRRRLSGAWVTVWSAAAITDASQVALSSTTQQPSAYYELNTDGNVYRGTHVSTNRTTIEAWRKAGASSQFQARATLQSGQSPGNVGIWLALSTTRQWACVDSVQGDGADATCTLLIEIRDASSLVVLTSATVTLTATWNSGGLG